MVHRILWECQKMQDSNVGTIQRSFRRYLARRSVALARLAAQNLRRQAGVRFLRGGAAATLSVPQLSIALQQQHWAVLMLQKHVAAHLEHQAWLARGSDFLAALSADSATVLQCAWRHKLACRQAISAIHHYDMQRRRTEAHDAASVIQRAMLARWARSELGELHRRELTAVLLSAATDVKRVWRGHAARNRVRNKLRAIEYARFNRARQYEMALRLQLAARCRWARHE